MQTEIEDAPIQALATTSAPIVGVAMMDAAEAREAVEWMQADIEMVDAYVDSFRRRLLDFRDREGWKALGYSSFKLAAQMELGSQYSKSYLSRLLQAAEIERNVELPIGNSVPESQLRPLGQLDSPEQQKQAWQTATADGKPTAAKVQAAVDQIKPPPIPADLLKAGVRLVPHGTWFKIEGLDNLNEWAKRAQPFDQAVETARVLIAQQQKPKIPDVPPPDLSSFGYTARHLPDGRIAIHCEGNLETEHTAGDLNDILQHWRSYPPIPADMAALGVSWRYRSDRMYQVENHGTPHHTGYTAEECLAEHRAYLERTGQLAAPVAPPQPDLADILLRLDAHGYAKTGTRQKGITTFYSFRDFGSSLEEGQSGEIELAEGELPYWLAELDDNAQRAQAKQERYLDAQTRADRLGYTLKRDGTDFVLSITGSTAALRGTLDAMIKTIEGYEKNAAKRATAVPALTIEQLDATLPKGYQDLGYFWVTAAPPTLGHIDGWRADAPTIALAIGLAADREKARTPMPATADWWNAVRAIERAMQHKKLGDACAATFGLLRLISGNEPKTRAAALLIACEREMQDLRTDDQEGLSQAISDLNECEEGTEVEHWLKVGYALCDVEP